MVGVMKKLQIKQEHKLLIESVIKESSKYKGNEQLLDLFCEAVYKKSYLLIGAIKDMPRLRRHLAMICDGCIDSVIREKNKFEALAPSKSKNKPVSNKEIVSLKDRTSARSDNLEHEFFMQKTKREIVNLKAEIQKSEKNDDSDTLSDPLESCPKKNVSQKTLEKLVQIVKSVDDKFPKKRYFEIFSYRYIKRYNQSQIAREMKLSQVELSKRFVEMIKLTREAV